LSIAGAVKAHTFVNLLRSPQAAGGAQEDLSKCGVGLYFEKDKNGPYMMVKEVTARGSAEREGSIRPGDKITAVDGIDIDGKSLHQIRGLIVGEPGTIVNLSIERIDTGLLTHIPLVRGNPMYWFWYDKNQQLLAQKDELAALLAELRRKLREGEDQRLKQQRDAQLALSEAQAESARTLRQVEDKLQEERAEHQRTEQRQREEAARALTEESERLKARIRDLETQMAGQRRQAEEEAMEKRAAMESALQQRAKDVASQLAALSASSNARIKELEAALGAKHSELEKATVGNVIEYDKALTGKVAELVGLLEAETQRHQQQLATQAEQGQQQVRRLEALLEQQRSQQNAAAGQLRAQVEERTQAVEKLEGERTRLASDVKMMSSKVQQLKLALETEAATWQEEREAMRMEVEAQRKSKEQNLARVASLMDHAVARFDNDVATLNDDIAKLQEMLRTSQAACLKAAGEARSMAERSRLLQEEKEALLQQLKTLQTERGTQLKEVEELRAVLVRKDQMLVASEGAQQQLTGEMTAMHALLEELRGDKRRLSDELAAAKTKLLDAQAAVEGMADLKAQLQACREAVAKLEGQVAENGDVEGLRGDVARLREEKLALMAKCSDLEINLKEELVKVTEERDLLKGEMNRFYALPNPCGVGMGLDLTVREEGGTRSEVLKVLELVPGMSAANSGAISPGDLLLEVDGSLTAGQQLDAVKGRIAGKRGSKLTLKFAKKSTGVEYVVLLKRGAWGAEHAVVAPEQNDMQDAGRYPQVKAEGADRDLVLF